MRHVHITHGRQFTGGVFAGVSMTVRAVGDDLRVLVGQHLRGKFIDLFRRDVQRSGDVRLAILFRGQSFDNGDLLIVHLLLEFSGGNCGIHVDLLISSVETARLAVQRRGPQRFWSDLGQNQAEFVPDRDEIMYLHAENIFNSFVEYKFNILLSYYPGRCLAESLTYARNGMQIPQPKGVAGKFRMGKKPAESGIYKLRIAKNLPPGGGMLRAEMPLSFVCQNYNGINY